jgi:hypothetical protein
LVEGNRKLHRRSGSVSPPPLRSAFAFNAQIDAAAATSFAVGSPEFRGRVVNTSTQLASPVSSECSTFVSEGRQLLTEIQIMLYRLRMGVPPQAS